MRVVYQGTADFKELNAADLQKAGIDGFKKTVFQPGVAVEVDDAVGELLVSLDHPLFGPELFAEEVDAPAEDEPKPKKSK